MVRLGVGQSARQQLAELIGNLTVVDLGLYVERFADIQVDMVNVRRV